MRQRMANVCHTGAKCSYREDSAHRLRTGSADAASARRGSSSGVGVLAYVLTVMQRTTLRRRRPRCRGPVRDQPGHAVGCSCSSRSPCTSPLQIPAGLLVDRFGSRVMLVASGLLLAAGQLLLAFATDLPLAVLGPGAGRRRRRHGVRRRARPHPALVPGAPGTAAHPADRRSSASSARCCRPCRSSALLHAPAGPPRSAPRQRPARWSPCWSWPSSATRRAGHGRRPRPCRPREIGSQLRAVWARPGTRLGFFGHMGTQFSMMVFALLWGVPYLVSAQGLSAATAGALMTLFVVCTIVIGPVDRGAHHAASAAPLLAAARGHRRRTSTVWTAVLALPGPAPLWLLVRAGRGAGRGRPRLGGRHRHRPHLQPEPNLGVAQSMVNLGGFLATLVVLAAMGAIMTALGGFTAGGLPGRLAGAVPGLGLRRGRRAGDPAQARRLDASRGVVPRPLRTVLADARTTRP